MTPHATIAGIDYALPEREVTNDDLAKLHPDWKIHELAVRTGVLRRRFARPGETALDLAERAARALFARVVLDPAEVDGVVVCTQTPDHVMPPNACLLQDRLKLAKTTAAFDFTLACSGYIYGLLMARSFIASGAMRTILLVTGDTYSSLIGPNDRATMSLFGDGVAATLIRASAEPGIGEILVGTDGSLARCFYVPAGGARMPRSLETAAVRRDPFGNERSLENIEMAGATVLGFVKREVPPTVARLLAGAHLGMDDIDLVVAHQASAMSFEALERALDIPAAKMLKNLDRVGNTVSASVPIALRDAERAGALRAGARLLLLGFGVGLSWGAAIVTWPGHASSPVARDGA